MKRFQKDFFDRPKSEVVEQFKRRVDTFLGSYNEVGTEHIEALHDLGYLPIRIKALAEGTLCPIRVPAMTFINTHPDFFWLTNYFETLLSTTLWLLMTSATTARLAKKELARHAEELFIVLQVGDILDRYECDWNLWISYLMSMRMDKVMDYGRPLSLKIVCDMLKTMKYRKIGVVEAHSDKTRTFLGLIDILIILLLIRCFLK